MAEPLLSVKDLKVSFRTEDGLVRAVDGISFTVAEGEVVGIVGESGSGKSVTMMSVMRLITDPNAIYEGEILYKGRNLMGVSQDAMREVRGEEIAMIFQDPMTSLNPVLKIGYQIAEAIKTHHPGTKDDAANKRAVDMLKLVGVPNPERRVAQYPHEFSGGMRQRAMIAMAIANEPSVLIADEPTTALDVTIQAQILEVLKKAQEETHAATILITHDLGLIAELADRVVVMYAGKVVELGDVETIFRSPRHPYTVGLMDSLPRLTAEEEWLRPIPGQPPSLISRPPGCPFHPRCFLSQGRIRCREEEPPLRPIGESAHLTACHFAEELEGRTGHFVEPVGAEA
ncbi:MAG: ABC transporter ATP-binding protein [Gaiellaceae bacterium]